MGEVIYNNLDRLTSREYRRVSLGLKPSGSIHLGTAMNFLNALLAMKKDPTSTLDATVMDLDFDFQSGADFAAFYKRRDDAGCHALAKEHTADETRESIGDIAKYFDIEPSRIKIVQFSEVTEHPQFKDYLVSLFGTEKAKRLLRTTVVGGNNKTAFLLSPICPDCNHSSTHAPKYHREESGNILLQTKCYNPDCGTGKFEVGLTEPGKSNLFYLVDPIRDLIPNAEGIPVGIHIFGGDYGAPYGNDGTPKAQRVHSLMAGLSSVTPDVYVGPIVTNYGTKIGKSSKNGLTVASVKDRFQNWVERLHSMLVENKEQKVIDLANSNHFS